MVFPETFKHKMVLGRNTKHLPVWKARSEIRLCPIIMS